MSTEHPKRIVPSRVAIAAALWCAGIFLTTRAAAQATDATQLFGSHCASCHTGASPAPSLAHLSSMPARAILAALEVGRMAQHANTLRDGERRALAEMLSGQQLSEATFPPEAMCGGDGRVEGPVAWSGWGGGSGETGYRDAEAAGLRASDLERLELAWALAIPGASQSRSKPAVVGEHVIVASAFGDVVALRKDSGCIEWHLQADAAVRGAVAVAPTPDGGLAAYFADFLTNVYAVDVQDGRLLWRTRVGRHTQHGITGSVAVHDGQVFVPLSSMEVVTAADPRYACCTSSGAIVALSAADGSERWYHRVISEAAGDSVAGAPVWSSPTVDAERGLLYFGTGEHYRRPTTKDSDAIRALDLATGRVAWTFQATKGDAYNVACNFGGPSCPDPIGPDFDFGMAPMIVTRPDGREILVVGQKSGMVYALDPDADGAVVWSTRVGRGGALGGIHWGMASDGRRAYAPVSDRYDGGLGGDAIVGPARPGLHALDLLTGEAIWYAAAPETCAGRQQCFAAYSAAPTAIDGVVFQGGLDGTLRAYASDDGRVLWAFDAAQEFETVGGVPGRGGALDGSGPVVADGMLFVNAGYGQFEQMPGNVVLAFRVKR